MFDKILPPIYRRLRERTKLSQELVASELGVTRQTVTNYESGKTRPEPSRERQLVALARCSLQELAELTCEEISTVLQQRVAILPDDKVYEPTTALGQAECLLRRRPVIPRSMLWSLDNKMHVTRLMVLALERLHADLRQHIADCLEAEKRQPAGAEANL